MLGCGRPYARHLGLSLGHLLKVYVFAAVLKVGRETRRDSVEQPTTQLSLENTDIFFGGLPKRYNYFMKQFFINVIRKISLSLTIYILRLCIHCLVFLFPVMILTCAPYLDVYGKFSYHLVAHSTRTLWLISL